MFLFLGESFLGGFLRSSYALPTLFQSSSRALLFGRSSKRLPTAFLEGFLDTQKIASLPASWSPPSAFLRASGDGFLGGFPSKLLRSSSRRKCPSYVGSYGFEPIPRTPSSDPSGKPPCRFRKWLPGVDSLPFRLLFLLPLDLPFLTKKSFLRDRS